MKTKTSSNKKPQPQITNTRSVRLILAAYILAMLIAQLFSFEDFPTLLGFLDINSGWQKLLTIVLVSTELMAIPFLIGMNVGKTVKKISLVALFVTLGLLSVLEVLAFLAGFTILFGATADLPGGSWSLFFLAAIWILTLWGVWDLLASKLKDLR